MEIFSEQMRSEVFASAPHVVLLGAGASKACLDSVGGDRNGRQSPVMNDIPKAIPEVRRLLETAAAAGVVIGEDFEASFAAIAANKSIRYLTEELESHVRGFFGSLELPDQATLYDHLVMALRPKDLIASFNWDPLLEQARLRTSCVPGPRVVYLHGNTAMATCKRCDLHQSLSEDCESCGGAMTQQPLLFPTPEKDYEQHRAQWDECTEKLQTAKLLTIFGYSAPLSDQSAVDIMSHAWGDIEGKFVEWIELVGHPDSTAIDRSRVRDRWSTFIPFETHATSFGSIFDSQVGMYPRRTVEVWFNTHVKPHFVESTPAPQDADLQAVQRWYQGLAALESGPG